MLERILLVIPGHEWRRGFACWMVRICTHRLGGRAPCFRCSFRLPSPSSEGRLALAKACGSAISVLRSHVRAFSSLDGATTFSSHVLRAAGPANLPSVRSTAIHFNGYGRRPSKDSAVHCFQDRTSMQTLPYTPSCVGPRLLLCLCSGHTARSHWSKHSFYGRAGFRLMPLLANGQELGQRCSCRSCALRCLLLPTRNWGACYRRPASLIRRAGKRSGRRRRRRAAPGTPTNSVRDLRAHACLSF